MQNQTTICGCDNCGKPCDKVVYQPILVQGTTKICQTNGITSYGSFYNTTNQAVNNTSFPFTENKVAVNMAIDPATGVITLHEAGVYYVHFGLYPNNGAISVDRMALQLNGVEIPGTSRRLNNTDMAIVSSIINVPQANDKINIQIYSTGNINFADLDNVNSYLVILKIA